MASGSETTTFGLRQVEARDLIDAAREILSKVRPYLQDAETAAQRRSPGEVLHHARRIAEQLHGADVILTRAQAVLTID